MHLVEKRESEDPSLGAQYEETAAVGKDRVPLALGVLGVDLVVDCVFGRERDLSEVNRVVGWVILAYERW